MGFFLDHMDEIARERGHDIYIIRFPQKLGFANQNKEALALHAEITNFLDQQNIKWDRCLKYFGGEIECAYTGDIFIDEPLNNDEPLERIIDFLKVNKAFEDNGIDLARLEIDEAMKNKDYYDECMDDV